jgi:hypothetical protein
VKLNLGFRSPNERNESAREDWECRKKRAAIFFSGSFFWFQVVCEWKLVKATGLAQRTKTIDWSETCCYISNRYMSPNKFEELMAYLRLSED